MTMQPIYSDDRDHMHTIRMGRAVESAVRKILTAAEEAAGLHMAEKLKALLHGMNIQRNRDAMRKGLRNE